MNTTRFNPTPNGALHLGHVYNILFNEQFAHNNGGKFYVRFEDGTSSQMVQNWKDKQAQGIKTLFLAMDMPPSTLEAVKDGVYVGSVGQDTYTEAFWGVMLLDALGKGQRVPDTLYLSVIMVDKDNVDQYIEK